MEIGNIIKLLIEFFVENAIHNLISLKRKCWGRRLSGREAIVIPLSIILTSLMSGGNSY